MTSEKNARQQVDQAESPTDDPYARPDDAGAHIGNRPEREAETIPGGISAEDQKIAAHSTQVGPQRDDSDAPADHREAGQSR